MLEAYVLRGKGPGMILGFPFLEEHKLLVDCHARVLRCVGGGEVTCFLVSTDGVMSDSGRFFWDDVDGVTPHWPTKKFPKDAGWDLYTLGG